MLRPAGHAHRKAASHESLAWVVILALTFVFIFVIVIVLAPVATPTIGDTPEARVAMGHHAFIFVTIFVIALAPVFVPTIGQTVGLHSSPNRAWLLIEHGTNVAAQNQGRSTPL